MTGRKISHRLTENNSVYCQRTDIQQCQEKLTTGWALSRSVCVSVETQAAPNATEGVEEHWPAGPARPGSSPAASLTAGWLHSWLISELVLLAGLAHSALAAGHLLRGGTHDIRATAMRVSSYLHCPGPGDENAGPPCPGIH